MVWNGRRWFPASSILKGDPGEKEGHLETGERSNQQEPTPCLTQTHPISNWRPSNMIYLPSEPWGAISESEAEGKLCTPIYILLMIYFSQNIKVVEKILKDWKVGVSKLHYFKFRYVIYSQIEFAVILVLLRLIKNYLRLSFSQGKLSDMAILSIKNETGEEVDFKNMVHKFASTKAKGAHFSFCFQLQCGLAQHWPLFTISIFCSSWISFCIYFLKYSIKIFFLIAEFFGIPLNFALGVPHPSPAPVNHRGPKLTFASWIASGIIVVRLVSSFASYLTIKSPLSAHDCQVSLREFVFCIKSSLFTALSPTTSFSGSYFSCIKPVRELPAVVLSLWLDGIYKNNSLNPLQGP